jgi:hypothetical protein
MKNKAGRHSLYGSPLKKCSFRIPDAHVKTLLEIDPNLSASLRVIMDDPRIERLIKKLIIERKERTNVTNAPHPD